MTAAEALEDDAVEVARQLSGARVLSFIRVGGGRNSRVFRAETDKGVFALKQYPSRTDDPRDRLGVEATALGWMAENGVDMVPRVVAVDRDKNFALLTWANGALVREVGRSDVDQAAHFLELLHRLRGSATFPVEHLATEACLSGKEIERQLLARVAHLEALTDEPELLAFLDQEFAPALAECLAAARRVVSEAGIPYDSELGQERRSLVPSDFGFHNALRDDEGRLTFIDFEYFGWDDPVKLTADVMLHPGTPVAPELRRHFGHAAESIYGDDPGFAARLKAYHPLFALRWVLIMLNEFHPERWRRRILAGATDNWSDAKARQLSAVRPMLANVTASRSFE